MAVIKVPNSFGIYLNELLTVKNIDKKLFSSILDINRTQLYRFLNGEQLPDLNLIQKMSTKLNLRTSEYEKLIESFECSSYGVEIIQGRKIIYNILDTLINQKKDSILNFSYSLGSHSLPPYNANSNSTKIIPLQSKNMVLNTFFSLLDSIRENGGKIRMIMQPDCKGLLDILPSILEYISENKIDALIEHIIRFRDITLEANKLYNLDLVEELLPLSKYESIYKVYYSVGNYDTVLRDRGIFSSFKDFFISYFTESNCIRSNDCCRNYKR